jgi:acyl-CoA thioesterase
MYGLLAIIFPNSVTLKWCFWLTNSISMMTKTIASTATTPATTTPSLTPAQIAQAVGEGMYAKDQAAKDLGIRLLAISPGAATMQMTVIDKMLNGFEICHGGYFTLLADTAFAYACNSYNELTVASSFSIDFLSPVFAGDVLNAVATEVKLSNRTGVYDVNVCNQHGELVSVFRGHSYRLKGKPVVDLDKVRSQ